MVKRNKLILDTDGGVDDAQALLLLIAHGYAPSAITTVFGNVDLESATRNMLATLAVAGLDIEVHMGAANPIAQPIIDARNIHGNDGLGGAERPEKTGVHASEDAVHYLRKILRAASAADEKIDILMIGPLTNLALAIRLDPMIINGIGQLTIMGGTVYGRGNTTPAAEFNVYADPEAASIIFRAEINTVVVPWEPCAAHYMTGIELDAILANIPDSPAKRFSQSLASHARQTIAGYTGEDAFRFVDPFAAAVIIDPTIVTRSITASVDVALAPGITRGMTVVDPSGRLGTPSVTLVEEAKLDRLIELYTASIDFSLNKAQTSHITGVRL